MTFNVTQLSKLNLFNEYIIAFVGVFGVGYINMYWKKQSQQYFEDFLLNLVYSHVTKKKQVQDNHFYNDTLLTLVLNSILKTINVHK